MIQFSEPWGDMVLCYLEVALPKSESDHLEYLQVFSKHVKHSAGWGGCGPRASLFLFYTVLIMPVSSSLEGWAVLPGGFRSQLPSSYQSREELAMSRAPSWGHTCPSYRQPCPCAHSSAQGKGMAGIAACAQTVLSFVSTRSATTHQSLPATPSPETLFSGKVMCRSVWPPPSQQ